MPFWLSDYKRLECTLLCLSSRLLPTKREKSLTRSKLQRKLKFGSTSCTTEEKERKKKENILGDLRGKPQQGPFLLNSLTNSQRRLRCNHVRTTRAALSVAASSSSFSRPLRGLATKDLVLRLAQEVSRASPAGSAAAGANEFCPSLRAIKTSLFGKSGKRFQNLLNGCRREASFLYDMHHKFVDKLYDFAKN